MTFTEFLTIYLAIGAPFGVYYFLKQRGESFNSILFLKSFGAALLWVLLAAIFLRHRYFSLPLPQRRRKSSNPRDESQIEIISQNLQTIFAKFTADERETLSFFEFRETLERYIGLTLATQNSSTSSPAPDHELEIFRVINHDKNSLQLAGRILHRKNYLLLQSHQSSARQDFLRVTDLLKENSPVKLNGEPDLWREYQTEALRLTEILKDERAHRFLQSETAVFEQHQQPSPPSAREHSGKAETDLWKTLQPSAPTKTFPNATTAVTSPPMIIRTRD